MNGAFRGNGTVVRFHPASSPTPLDSITLNRSDASRGETRGDILEPVLPAFEAALLRAWRQGLTISLPQVLRQVARDLPDGSRDELRSKLARVVHELVSADAIQLLVGGAPVGLPSDALKRVLASPICWLPPLVTPVADELQLSLHA